MTRRALSAAGLAAAVVLLTGACGSGGASDAAGDKIPVVASTNVWAGVVTAIGGDAVSVKALIDSPVADPHSYETTAEDALDFTEAKLAVVNGGGYDEFAHQLADQAKDVPLIDAFELSGHAEEDHAEAAEEGHADEHDHGGVNEHVWYDLHTVSKVADAVAAQLGKLEPAKAEEFTANAKRFTSELAKVEGQLAELPKGAKVLATEPVAHYLLEAGGLKDVTPPAFSNAIEGDSDIPVAAQDAVNQLIERKQVSVLVNNPQTETDVTKELLATAERAGVPVVDITETLPEGETDYVQWLRAEVAQLQEALAS